MTKRFASQLLLSPEGEWMSNAVLELSEMGTVERSYSLSGLHTETARTLFLDGVIAPSLLSLHEYLTKEDIRQLTKSYFYLNLESEIITLPSQENKKPLLIDFGSSDLQIAEKNLIRHLNSLSRFSMREIIMATSIRPERCLSELLHTALITKSMMLWEDVDFAGDRLTIDTRLRPLL